MSWHHHLTKNAVVCTLERGNRYSQTYTHPSPSTYTHTHSCTCVRTHTHTHTYNHTHTHTQPTHTHPHTHTLTHTHKTHKPHTHTHTHGGHTLEWLRLRYNSPYHHIAFHSNSHYIQTHSTFISVEGTFTACTVYYRFIAYKQRHVALIKKLNAYKHTAPFPK